MFDNKGSKISNLGIIIFLGSMIICYKLQMFDPADPQNIGSAKYKDLARRDHFGLLHGLRVYILIIGLVGLLAFLQQFVDPWIDKIRNKRNR